MLLFGSHFEGKIRFHLPAPIIKFTRPPVRVRHQIDWQADQPEERGQHTDLLPSAHDCLPRTAHSVALWTDWCERESTSRSPPVWSWVSTEIAFPFSAAAGFVTACTRLL